MKDRLSNATAGSVRRIGAVSISLLLLLSVLIASLVRLQIFGHESYKDKVYDQITTTSPLKAERGNIYDRNMSLLAGCETEWRIFISTKDIRKAKKESGRDVGAVIARGLSSILGISEPTLLERIEKTNTLDVTIKRSASEEEYKKVIEFVRESSLWGLVFTEAHPSRYYPEGTLAAHALGFVGSDTQGLYGLELYYDSILSGKDGYYLYAKDANGNALDTEYATYVEAEKGYSLVTTIDSFVQRALETQLATIVEAHSVENRVTGVVMDTSSGAILAMATSSPFDPNDPYTLDAESLSKLGASGLTEGSEEYKKYKRELLEVMWSNKAVSETYEPGSTFKIITVAAALDSGSVSLSDTFSCRGYHEVGGRRIRCHKTTGHGSGFSLSYGLQMSCNPAMMTVADKMGAETFYKYIQDFGYLERSGIDLPSEARTIFHSPDAIGSTELATISFGQRFKVTVINHLSAIAAVANGGMEVTPYLVEKVIDGDGNVISEHQGGTPKRMIGESVARSLADILEKGVSGDGGARNAYVDGYKVAAKTGTSQKFDILDENGNSYLRIGSTVAFAPSDGSGIAVIIVVDEPTASVKYGSVVAAPYISALLTDILPYLEYESSKESVNAEVESFVGMGVKDAAERIGALGLRCEVIGGGDTVLSQTPGEHDIITHEGSKILLYTEEIKEMTSVPSLVGMSIDEALKCAARSGLNVRLRGSGGGTVITQSLPLGATVERGDIIELYTLVTDHED